MLTLSDWREDIRLLRLNNPSYRALFVMISVMKWALYLCGATLLIAFCWLVMSPHSPMLPAPDVNSRSVSSVTTKSVASDNLQSQELAAGKQTTSPANEVLDTTTNGQQISAERIEYLRNFASRAKAQALPITSDDRPAVLLAGSATESTTSPAPSSSFRPARTLPGETSGVVVYPVTKPDDIKAVIIPASSGKRDVLSASTNAVPRSGLETTKRRENENTSDHKEDASPAENTYTAVQSLLVGKRVTPLSADRIETTGTTGSTVENTVVVPNSASVAITSESIQYLQTDSAVPVAPRVDTIVGNSKDRHQPHKTQAWVLSRNSNHYTVQIGATVNRPFLARFQSTLPDDQVVALFKHRINRWNREEYVLSYGVFTSYEAASAALDSLSQSARRYGAYVRSFGSIQEETRKLKTVAAQVSPTDIGNGLVNNQ